MATAAAAGCAILTAGLAWQAGLFSVPSLPQRTITFTVPVNGAVRGACHDGLTDIWPRMPGWTITAAGCARNRLPAEGYRRTDRRRQSRHRLARL